MRQRRLFGMGAGVLLVLVAVVLLWRPALRSPAPRAGDVAVAVAGQPVTAGFRLENSREAIAAAASHTALFQHRVSNTPAGIGALTRNDHAILLRNALIDTTRPLELAIPAEYRAASNTSTYLVQSRGVLSDNVRALLQSAGARVVSYIPNNAYLVRVAPEAVDALRASPLLQAVLPFEPFYKLDARLFDGVAAQYRVLGYPGEEAALEQALTENGAEVLGRSRTQLGTIFTVAGRGVPVAQLARIDSLQIIEPKADRVAATDMTRVLVGVSTNTTAKTNDYLGLSGTNVLVAIGDTGFDTNHPALTPRVTVADTNAAADPDGHGTFVTGVVMGDGTGSEGLAAAGSVTNAVYRGMAPGAKVFGMRAMGDEAQTDAELQEGTARTNALISNQSWSYVGAFEYDLAAASYDAAVRDAQPTVSGSQPVLFVYAAGNSGFGGDNGLAGEPGGILSPATSKNGISVGATELPRNITNEVVVTNYSAGTNADGTYTGTTNQPWAGQTDSADQVAAFSSRGNVGQGIEGDRGRFKPDVVAPGVFLVAPRSKDFDPGPYYNPTNFEANRFFRQRLEPGAQANYSIFVPANAVQLRVDVLANNETVLPLPPLEIYVRQVAIPTTNQFDVLRTNTAQLPPDHALTPVATTWFYSVRNPGTNLVSVDVRTLIAKTNDLSEYYTVLSNLNETLDPNHKYMYRSGTSVAAPVVSGLLALMEEFFEQRLQPLYSPTNRPSPALLKALVINGARSLGPQYSLTVLSSINLQGWGLVNLTNSLPGSLSNLVTHAGGTNTSFMFCDQSPTNALRTGQSRTWKVRLAEAARIQPLRATLVWTDPPGNPAAGPKLVNDLDLIVTNLDTGEVFLGNNIFEEQDFNSANNTNDVPRLDVINNVENVFLAAPLGSNYSVTVNARRVNVNAVTAQTNGIAQDFALVISSGEGDALTNAFTITDAAAIVSTNEPNVTLIRSNGVPLLFQHVGANDPLITTTNGTTNQWHFYVFTNSTSYSSNGVAYTNVAFATFVPPELSVPRMGVQVANPDAATRVEADLDLYVSSDPALLQLSPTAIAGASRSVKRGGTEVVAFSNAAPDQVYYVGVKSEDQMAAEFGFLAVASLLPFSFLDADGNQIVNGLTLPVVIPDGSPSQPGGVYVFGIALYPMEARKVTVTNTLTHQAMGDLLGNLSHARVYAVLNNHRPGDNGTLPETYIYDDSGEYPIPGAQPTDGPGSLQDFVGEDATGLWMLTMVDNSLNQTGQVDGLTLKIAPTFSDDSSSTVVIPPNSFVFDSVYVPPEATNLTVSLLNHTLPLELYLRKDANPTRRIYDKFAVINPPAGSLSISLYDAPPLSAGRYYIGIFNPNLVPQTVKVVKQLGLAATPANAGTFVNGGATPLIDDAVAYSYLTITNDEKIARAEVGVIIEHPRVADLALTLVSPNGKRVLLTEDRGYAAGANYGAIIYTTNVFPQSADGGPAAATNVIAVGANAGTLQVDYDFYTITDRMVVIYDGQVLRDFSTGGSNTFSLNFGPGASTDLTIVMNPGNNTDTNTLWEYVASVASASGFYAIFTDDTNKTTTPIKFAPPPFMPGSGVITVLTSGFETTNRVYTNTEVFDGWTVFTNQVTVISNAAAAHTGVDYLSLRTGGVLTNFPTVPGRRYELNHVYRQQPQPLHWWRAENNALDSIGQAHGTYSNQTAQSYVAGLAGQGFNFNAVDQNVTVPDEPSLNPTNAITLMCWVNARQYPPTFGFDLLSKDPEFSTERQYLLTMGPGNAGNPSRFVPHVGVRNPGYQFLNFLGTTPVLLNTWYHVAMTYDGALLRLYVNGTLDGSLPVTGPIVVTPEPFRIGGGGSMPPDYLFPGLIDEVVMYDHAVDAPTIHEVFIAGAAGHCGTTTPPAPCTGATNRVVDGSFESVAAQYYDAVTNLGAWVVTNNATTTTNSIEVDDARLGVPPFWHGASGYQSVDLDGRAGEAGTLYQDVPTTERRPYRLRFAMAGNPNNPAVPAVKTMQVSAGQARLGTFTFDTTGHSATNMGWVYYTADFIATTPTTRIQFTSLSGSGWGPVIDDVSLLPLPTALVSLGTQTNRVEAGNTAWQTNTLTFLAKGSSATITAQGIDSGVELDSFVVTEQQDSIYYLPEAFLSDLIGENAKGVWTLEAWDTRVGATNVAPRILNWKLDLAFENTVPLAQPLYFAEIVTNTIPPNSSQYYLVDVPLWAGYATNLLTNATGNLSLIYNANDLPKPGTPGNFTLLADVTNGVAVLSAASTPVLVPGSRYYLAVTNASTNSVTYHLSVEFDVTALSNAVPVTASQPAFLPRYYSFDVSTNAAAVTFETFNASGNVDLVVRRGLPLPTLGDFDFGSFKTGTNDDYVIVTTNTQPVQLTPGRWYLGVFNVEPTPTTYSVRATESTDLTPVLGGYTVQGNSLCLTWSSFPGFTYYVVGKVDLNDLAWVPVSPSITATDRTTTWCVSFPTPYHFFRVVLGTGPTIPDPGTPVIVPPHDLVYFVVPVPAWPQAATNSLLLADKPLDLLFNQNGLPTTGTAPGDVVLLANSLGGVATLLPTGTPPLQTNLNYYLALLNTNDTAVTAYLQVEFNATELTNGVAVTDALVNSSIPRYFFINVPADAQVGAFELFNLSGNADLVIQEAAYGIPTLTSYDYGSFNPGTNNDVLGITTTSQPYPLTAGRWNLSVVNRSAGSVNYSVRATTSTNADPVIRKFVISATDICLTWGSIPGTNYFVQGRIDLNDAGWTPISPAITATTIETTYCIAQPTPYQFFRIATGNPPVSVNFSGILQTAAGFELNWTAGTADRFQVQWSPGIPATGWNTFTNVVTPYATNLSLGLFRFTDDGSQTGGFGGGRYYRLQQVP